MRHQELRQYVIQPVLKSMNMYSLAAEELLVLTAATESHLGAYLHQTRGPAIGIYQMEPATYKDIWDNYLNFRPQLAAAAEHYQIPGESFSQLAGNLYYATAMARLHYRRSPHKMPEPHDIEGLAQKWKLVYNTDSGKGTVEKAIEDYRRLVR